MTPLQYIAAAFMLAATLAAGAFKLEANAAREEAAQWKHEAEACAAARSVTEAGIELARGETEKAQAKAEVAARLARDIAREKPALTPAPKGCEQAAAWARQELPRVLEGWR